MKKEIAIGVDIGGSHVSCAAYDLNVKKYIENSLAENDLDNHANSEVIIGAWGDTIKRTMELVGSGDVVGIGFAMPGPFDYENGIPLFTGENEKYENIYGLHVPDALRKYLNLADDFRIRFVNDATAFAIAEDQVGRARDVIRSLSITLGTGFGSAFISSGMPVLEGEEVPRYGCLWHLPFEDGIADDYFSTRGFLNRYKKETGIELPGVKQLAEKIDSDNTANALFEDFGLKLGQFLKPWIRKFEIQMLVIGGNISNAYPHFEESLNDYLKNEQLEMQVAPSEMKEIASFIGSATMVDDTYYHQVRPLLKKM